MWMSESKGNFALSFVIVINSRSHILQTEPDHQRFINNRLFIHDYPAYFTQEDIEKWLESVGKLECWTSQGRQRRHIVIWKKAEGINNAVA